MLPAIIAGVAGEFSKRRTPFGAAFGTKVLGEARQMEIYVFFFEAALTGIAAKNAYQSFALTTTSMAALLRRRVRDQLIAVRIMR